jgi:hypothetical protein
VARTGTGAPDGSGIASFAPLQVKVLNPNGTPAKGVEVGFSIFDSNGLPLMPFGMECQLQPDGSPFSVAITDSNGIATLNQFSSGNSIFCYYNSGPFTVLAYTAGGSTTPVIFHETVSS